jgi:DNA-binding transcriptional ArsR family regulator
VNTFAALADPTRAEILDVIARRPRTVNEIVARFDVSQPAISRHLRVLREAGLVSVVPKGQQRVYRLEPKPLQELDTWLSRYRRFWADRLDALEQHMDEEPE